MLGFGSIGKIGNVSFSDKFRVDPVFLKNFKLDASESDRGGGGGGGEQIKLME